MFRVNRPALHLSPDLTGAVGHTGIADVPPTRSCTGLSLSGDTGSEFDERSLVEGGRLQSKKDAADEWLIQSVRWTYLSWDVPVFARGTA
jgi:hypothetical protein